MQISWIAKLKDTTQNELYVKMFLLCSWLILYVHLCHANTT